MQNVSKCEICKIFPNNLSTISNHFHKFSIFSQKYSHISFQQQIQKKKRIIVEIIELKKFPFYIISKIQKLCSLERKSFTFSSNREEAYSFWITLSKLRETRISEIRSFCHNTQCSSTCRSRTEYVAQRVF